MQTCPRASYVEAWKRPSRQKTQLFTRDPHEEQPTCPGYDLAQQPVCCILMETTPKTSPVQRDGKHLIGYMKLFMELGGSEHTNALLVLQQFHDTKA